MAKHKGRHLEIIRWIDSHSPGAQIWLDPDEIPHTLMPITTAGFIIHENRKSITVASTITDGPDGQVSGVISIPKVAITKRTKVKAG